ncbi:MAG: FAD-dependent oxidoreductase [Mycobacteriales bacterium]
MSGQRVVIVGASLAGASAASRLRRLGHDGPIALVGAEPQLPYERPGLSKGYLTGALSLDQLLVHPAEMYDELDIELRLGLPAAGVDVDRRRVLLGGEELPYDALVLATGSANLRPPIPGIDLDGVHQLRTVEDADALRAAAQRGGRAVVVGTGFIGCEVAATLRSEGLDVTALDGLPGPLWNVLGPEISAVVRGWHRDNGTTVLGDAPVASFAGSGRVEQVLLQDGRVLPADLVIVGVGARPALDWLDHAPLDRAAGGIGVDQQGRTSVADVYAIGDMAAAWDPVAREHRRVEHYSSALAGADGVAHAVLGLDAPERKPPWFWSDQYDHALHYTGHHRIGDETVLRLDGSAAFFLRGDALVAALTIDNGRDMRRAMRLLGQKVDRGRLSNPTVDVRTAGLGSGEAA